MREKRYMVPKKAILSLNQMLAHDFGNGGAAQHNERKGCSKAKDSPLAPLQETQLSQHLDFNTANLLLNFSSPEL